jgi:hypothetical protein
MASVEAIQWATKWAIQWEVKWVAFPHPETTQTVAEIMEEWMDVVPVVQGSAVVVLSTSFLVGSWAKDSIIRSHQ